MELMAVPVVLMIVANGLADPTPSQHKKTKNGQVRYQRPGNQIRLGVGTLAAAHLHFYLSIVTLRELSDRRL